MYEQINDLQIAKGDILILSNNLIYSLFMGNTRKGALEDAYSTLNKIKKSKEVKTVKKNRFSWTSHESKNYKSKEERKGRQIHDDYEQKQNQIQSLLKRFKNHVFITMWSGKTKHIH